MTDRDFAVEIAEALRDFVAIISPILKQAQAAERPGVVESDLRAEIERLEEKVRQLSGDYQTVVEQNGRLRGSVKPVKMPEE